jgi:hypothetical protein
MKFIWMQEKQWKCENYVTWKQMDVARASRPTLPHWPIAMWHRPVPRCPHPHHRSMAWLLHCLIKRWFHVGSSRGRYLLIVDPWAHYHSLGGHQLTLEPPYRPNLHMCWQGNCLWEPTKTLRCNSGASKGWSAPTPSRPMPKAPPPPLCCLQIPPGSLVL